LSRNAASIFRAPIARLFPNSRRPYETTRPGVYVIGALAGYPLIKHCMNQGHDVVEFINGNTTLKPADEPILAKKFAHFRKQRSVDEWLALLKRDVAILADLSPLQCASHARFGDAPVRRRRSDLPSQ